MADVNHEEPAGESDGDVTDVGDYCRRVEAYLCQKNDGHLIRIAGPSFMRVSGWAREGIPLNVVYRGVDRYFERYYARGQRRRPVHIDFCEGDVLAVFDEWRRAVGSRPGREQPEHEDEGAAERNPAEAGTHVIDTGGGAGRGARRRPHGQAVVAPAEEVQARTLQAHVERVIVRLTTLRAGGRLTPAADAALDAAIRELDAKRGQAALLEGDGRAAFLGRLRDLDARLLETLADALNDRERAALDRDAAHDLAPFRAGMTPAAYEQALAGNRMRLIRERTGLPVIAYTD